MLTWYNDDNLKIEFSDYPDVDIRYPQINMTKEEKEACISKPFICENEIKVRVKQYNIDGVHQYCFTIPKNYCWDGASIPRAFWRIIGAKTDPRFLIPSMVHDILCENHNFVNNDRYLADRIFEKLLKVSGVGAFKRWLMFHSVDNFQKFCKW